MTPEEEHIAWIDNNPMLKHVSETVRGTDAAESDRWLDLLTKTLLTYLGAEER